MQRSDSTRAGGADRDAPERLRDVLLAASQLSVRLHSLQPSSRSRAAPVLITGAAHPRCHADCTRRRPPVQSSARCARVGLPINRRARSDRWCSVSVEPPSSEANRAPARCENREHPKLARLARNASWRQRPLRRPSSRDQDSATSATRVRIENFDPGKSGVFASTNCIRITHYCPVAYHCIALVG